MHKKGLTLLEILVSTLILALVMTGMVNLFISGKRWVLRARSRMTSGELGKYFLDDLQSLVRQDTWSDATRNCLGTASCPDKKVGTAQGLDRDYTGKYTITKDYPIANINKVKVDISWSKIE